MDRVPLFQNDTTLKNISLSQIVTYIEQSTTNTLEPLSIAQQVLAWTNGQPELTQYLLKVVLDRQSQPFTGNSIELVNEQVKTYFSSALLESEVTEKKPVFELFKTLEKALLQDQSQGSRRLQYYQAVLIASHRLPQGYQTEHDALTEVGLIYNNDRGQTKVFNPIYRRVFNMYWIEKQLEHPSISGKEHWLLFTSLLSILAFIVLQSLFRYIPVANTHQCHQESDLRDAVLAKLSLEPKQMQNSINRLLTLQEQNQLGEQCQTVLHDLQYSYGIYVSAGTHNNPLDAAQYLCQIPESYYVKRNVIPWFSRWTNIYKSTDFEGSLAGYVAQYSCPGYSFLNRIRL